jgi:hypothetical protein
MSGQDSSPIEPTKAHTHTIGRGGVGNLQEAKKYAGLPHEQPQIHRVEPVVPSHPNSQFLTNVGSR